jgi:hypothetical protein
MIVREEVLKKLRVAILPGLPRLLFQLDQVFLNCADVGAWRLRGNGCAREYENECEKDGSFYRFALSKVSCCPLDAVAGPKSRKNVGPTMGRGNQVHKQANSAHELMQYRR